MIERRVGLQRLPPVTSRIRLWASSQKQAIALSRHSFDR